MAVSDLIDSIVRTTAAGQNIRAWRAEEYEFVRRNLTRMSLDEIGSHLGRTSAAVKIKVVREGIPSASKRPGWYTGNQAAKVLCIDVHTVCELGRRGILPLEILPGPRRIRRLKIITLWVWAINPMHWIYFKPHRVRDARLRRLIELRQARWGDEWWTTGRVAAYHGLAESSTVTMAIYRGRLPAVRWQNWNVRRSDAIAWQVSPRKGRPGVARSWTPAADAFILRAREMGLSYVAIERMMKRSHESVRVRYKRLMESMP